jgi:hypothetical protein
MPNVKLHDVRLDWVFITQPNKKGKYGCAVMIPKGSPMAEVAKKAFDEAKQEGIQRGLFTAAQTKGRGFKSTLRDGDEEVEAETQGPHYKGHIYINASSNTMPGVIDSAGNDIPPNAAYPYSGCYCHVILAVKPFYNDAEGARGVTAYVQHVMFHRDGERLDGRMASTDAFKAELESTESAEDALS